MLHNKALFCTLMITSAAAERITKTLTPLAAFALASNASVIRRFRRHSQGIELRLADAQVDVPRRYILLVRAIFCIVYKSYYEKLSVELCQQ
jgi:hypothetical protein